MIIAPGEVTQILNLTTKGSEKSPKKPYKVVKLLNRIGGNAQIINVTDYQAREWTQGTNVEIACFLDVYNGARGPGYNLIACKDQEAGRMAKGDGNGNGNGKKAAPY